MEEGSVDSLQSVSQKEVNQSATKIDQKQGKHENSLVNEKNIKKSKARQAKQAELKKHVATYNDLKDRLANNLIDHKIKVEEMK